VPLEPTGSTGPTDRTGWSGTTARSAPKRITVIGHPLAAEENRLAFHGWVGVHVDLIVPSLWKARSLRHEYRTPASTPGAPGQPGMHPLGTLGTGRNSLFLWKGLGPLLRRLRPDAIYCWEEPWCLSTWQVTRIARTLGIPVIFYTAENRPKRLPWPFRILLRAAFRACPACVAPTEEISARIRAWGFPGKVFVIPLWVRTRRSVRARAADKCLAYVGRLIPLKRVDLLVETMALLPEFRLRIIGDGPERWNLAELAHDLGLDARVDFRGHIENGRLEEGLEGASLLVMPTAENARQAEQFGKAAIEGVSCGLPVLASRTGNLTALAVVFPTVAARDLDSPEQMAEAVTGLFRDFPAETSLAEARKRADETYGPAAAARRLQAAFTQLLSSGTAAGNAAIGNPAATEMDPARPALKGPHP